MTHYTLVCLTKDSGDMVGKLQDFGLVDIRRSRKSLDEKASAMLEEAEKIHRAMGGIELKQSLAAVDSEISALRKELSAAQIWGSYDKSKIDSLKESGYSISFHCISQKKFDASLAAECPISVIAEQDGKVYFVAIHGADIPEKNIGGEIAMPRETAIIEADITEKSTERENVKSMLDELPSLQEEMQKEYDAVLARLDAYIAEKATQLSEDDGEIGKYVDVYEAFAQTEDDEKVAGFLDTLPVYYTSEKAEAHDDSTPIKLKNNAFIKNFEVLTGMYGMPVYSEFDPTPILGPFFLLFFSMCMGDAGYGLLLMLIALFLKKKMPTSSLGSMWQLIMYLGIGTAVVGFFLGTFFGLDLYSLFPENARGIFLKGNVSVPGFGDFDLQMVLAICIGVVHLCIAMTVKAICFTKRFGLKETISTWGWLILILGLLITGGVALCGVISSSAVKIAIIIIGSISALAILVFNKPGRNPLINIGAGLWDVYGMVTGLLGDVLSYIRLYALGLAGGMLGAAFNNLGQMVLGDGGFRWIFFILILIVGHALNLAMSCLGAFVHPLRLSFVEYFKNSGYEGKGHAFQPLTKNNNK